MIKTTKGAHEKAPQRLKEENKKEKQAESKENILEEQVSKEPKVIGIKKK